MTSLVPAPSATSLSPIHLLRGLRLLAAPELRRFVWAPLLANLLLYGAALYAGIRYFAVVMQWLLPTWLGFLAWLLWPLFALSFVLLMYFSFTMVANLIGSPFYGLLAEKVLARAGGGDPASPEAPLGKAMLEGVATELRRLRYSLARALPFLLLFAIPGLNLAAPFLWMAFNAWSLALEYLAYPLEARGVGFEEQRQKARGMRGGMLQFGGAAMLGLAVPGLNILIPPAAVAGAALFVAESGGSAEGSPAGR